METDMRALAASALVLSWVAAASPAAATVYVPGHYKDGIYVRPHFLDYPGQSPGGPLLLPPDQEAAKAKEAQDQIMLEREAPGKPQPVPAS
jgi:hypothetical protein